MNHLSVVIPVFNEERNLMEFFQRIDALALPIPKELIIVDDFSTDGSRKLIQDFKFRSPVKKIYLNQNSGKGAALRAGFSEASGFWIGIQDADFEYDINEISTMIGPLLAGEVDVVFGNRFDSNHHSFAKGVHYFANKFLTYFSNLCGGLKVIDMETCYKFFRADLLKSIILESNRFGFEPEIVAKLSKLKVRLLEVPIRYKPRTYAQGKKIRWWDGVAAIYQVIQFNFFRDESSSFKATLPMRCRRR